jgi:class 3 adenylate cyclase/predicted ATPase
MTFDEVLEQAVKLLQRQGRISYRALKRHFELEDNYLADLKEELLYSYAPQIKEEGSGLVWMEGLTPASASGGNHTLSFSSDAPAMNQVTDSPSAREETSPSVVAWRTTSGERRQVTVMFCDLVGSVALSEQLDPEEWRDVLGLYQEACARVINRFEGYIAQYLGDGLLVYFGYPVAHEDDSRRSIHAGLGIVRELQQLNDRPQSPLQVRIGIHTGLVVAGGVGNEQTGVVGKTPNIAARLQGIAQPGTVVISEATYQLTQGFFRCRDLGLQSLKGVSDPVAVYQVLEESDISSRLEIAAARGLTPLVGRKGEIGLLLKCWEQVKEEQEQAVLLMGEAGIGKSRLIHVLKEHCANENPVRLEAYCSPYHQNSALHPAIDLLQRALQFRREDSPDEKLEKLVRMLAPYEDLPSETVPLLAALLSLPGAKQYPPLSFTPQKLKERTLHCIVAWLLRIAEQQPLLLILEDLHWADPSTLELLDLLLARVTATSTFIVLTARPEFTSPWVRYSHLTRIALNRLNRKQVEEMVEQIAGGQALPSEVVQQLVDRTDGIPLFVEELTKTVLESGLLRAKDGHSAGAYGSPLSLPSLAIPATLSDSLMERLDRLTTAKEVAQLGAIIGREFSYELLAAVSLWDEATLQRELVRLMEAGLLQQRGEPSQAKYIFKHALIWDTAYQSILKSKRQQYHQYIAHVLETQFPETQELHPELLAHHYTEARVIDKAINYWLLAGQKDFRRSANLEAISHLTKGLDLLAMLAESPERVQRELKLQIALGGPLVMTKGYAAAEVEQVYARARDLCRQLGETPQLFPVLVGLWVFYLVRAELGKAHELGHQLLRLAQSVQDPALLLEAHNTIAHSSFYRGEFSTALEHAEQCIALYDVKKHHSLALLYVHDPGVFSFNIAAWSLWHLGYPDQALRRNRQSMSLAEQLSHPFSMAQALFNGAALHQLRQEADIAQNRAEGDITVCTSQGFPFWGATGLVLRGWAIALQGQEEEGITQIHQGIAAHCSTGANLGRPYFLSLLAEVYGRVGKIQEGIAAVEEALPIVSQNDERHQEVELHRVKGELILQQLQVQGAKYKVSNSPPLASDLVAEAEACFLKAVEVARAQRAKSPELRAVTSLARLWKEQGKRAEARRMLAEIYGWFTEGFDTADLKTAKALLDNLASRV